jgi:hypothetical protein
LIVIDTLLSGSDHPVNVLVNWKGEIKNDPSSPPNLWDKCHRGDYILPEHHFAEHRRDLVCNVLFEEGMGV